MPKYARYAAGAAVSLLFWLTAVSAGGEDHRHVVIVGDTLSGLAQHYGVTVREVVERNRIENPDLSFPDEVLEIPSAPTTPQAELSPVPHRTCIVKPGDTLSAISIQYKVSVQGLQIVNRLNDPNFIVAGLKLLIPPAEAPAELKTPARPPSDPDLEAIIDELASVGGVDPGLIKAIAWVESGWQQGAVSPRRAIGVMQLI